jgi:F420-dependent oxidoreductase-like protein
MVVRLPDPVLVVLVGVSASGKSHWAREHFHPDQIVSSDRLRAVVGTGERDLTAGTDAFAVLELVVAARLRRRLTTVIDTLGMDGRLRRQWLELAAAQGVPAVAVVFDAPAAECRRRNQVRENPVPQAVLSNQLARFRTLRLDGESFDQVIRPAPVRVVDPEVAAASRARTVPDDASGLPASSMRFGLYLSVWAGAPRERLAERLSDVARRAETAGFTSIWVMDHFRQIPQLGRPWEDMPESTATLGYLAAATTTATIGALVNSVTYRNVAHLGRIVATLDVLSGGRARAGLGAGWFKEEHDAYGYAFPPAAERLDLLEDALRLLPLLWGPGAKGFTGKRITVGEAMGYPRPLQARVPILVGGQGERRTLRLVAELADACNLTGDADAVRHKLTVLHQHCEAVGRDPGDIEVTHLSTLKITGGRREPAARPRSVRVVAGTADDHLLRLRALADAGVQHAIVSLADVWEPGAVERFGDVIAARP